jgi:hypothetical protein
MADKYTIQVNPQISGSDAQKMEQDLNRRFSNVAKKFGTNLGNSIKNAAKIGTAALVAGAVGKVLSNPFEKVNEDFNKIITTSDDIVTRANQFGVSAAKFGELVSLAGSVGLDPTKALLEFSDALQEARLFAAGDETKNDALVNFTNEKDLLDAFYAFIASVNKLDATQRSVEVSKIFGNRLEDKLAEFLQIPDMKNRSARIFSGVTPEQVGKERERQAEIEDIQAILRERRANLEVIAKGRNISSQTAYAQNAYETAKIQKESEQLNQFAFLAKISESQQRATEALEKIQNDIVDNLTPKVKKFSEDFTTVKDWVISKFKTNKNNKVF